MFDCDERSGSLNERRCFDPEAIAFVASCDHVAVFWSEVPQSIGTYSSPDATDPPGVDPQLYAQLIEVPLKALVRDGSL